MILFERARRLWAALLFVAGYRQLLTSSDVRRLLGLASLTSPTLHVLAASQWLSILCEFYCFLLTNKKDKK